MPRLSELHGRFVGAGGEGVYTTGPDGELVPAPERHGVGVLCDCPCGCEYELCVLFENPMDGLGRFDATTAGHYWQRVGDTIDTLTLTPSIQCHTPCNWHGFIREGGTVNA